MTSKIGPREAQLRSLRENTAKPKRKIGKLPETVKPASSLLKVGDKVTLDEGLAAQLGIPSEMTIAKVVDGTLASTADPDEIERALRFYRKHRDRQRNAGRARSEKAKKAKKAKRAKR